MSKAEQKVEGEVVANVRVCLVGTFPAKWSSIEAASIVGQLIARGIQHSPHMGELEVRVEPIGGSSISSHEHSPVEGE